MFTFVTIVTRKKLIVLVVHLVYSHYPGLDSMRSRLSGYIWGSEDSYQYLCRLRCQAVFSYNENTQFYLLGLPWLSSLLWANCSHMDLLKHGMLECAAGVIQKLLWWKVFELWLWVSSRNFPFTGALWTSAAAALQKKEQLSHRSACVLQKYGVAFTKHTRCKFIVPISKSKYAWDFAFDKYPWWIYACGNWNWIPAASKSGFTAYRNTNVFQKIMQEKL